MAHASFLLSRPSSVAVGGSFDFRRRHESGPTPPSPSQRQPPFARLLDLGDMRPLDRLGYMAGGMELPRESGHFISREAVSSRPEAPGESRPQHTDPQDRELVAVGRNRREPRPCWENDERAARRGAHLQVPGDGSHVGGTLLYRRIPLDGRARRVVSHRPLIIAHAPANFA